MHRLIFIRSLVLRIGVAALSLELLACSSAGTSQGQPSGEQTGGPPESPPSEGAARIADLQIVDCLLPGMLRKLGNTQYLTQRRPTRTTASDCRLRGGEYTAYDRATLKSSLAVWMPAAEAGDVEAMVNVGEIFERGLGDQPNYEVAAIWYRKAADAGNSRAQFNLGTLYEQGLGVPEDRMLALNWYRKAWGMENDDIVFQSVAATELAEVRSELSRTITARERRIDRLAGEVNELQLRLTEVNRQGENDAAAKQAMQRELEDLQLWIDALEQERMEAQEQLAAVSVTRSYDAPSSRTTSDGDSVSVKRGEFDFGNYFALVIGNQDYAKLSSLQTPVNDATRVAEVLNKKYGFSVQLLLNATNVEAMEAINDLYERVGANDNLLIYYAGHGARVPSGEIENGYWLPVNADAPPRDTYWVSNEFITGHLSRIPAKRVLVIADSCYAGLLSNSPGYLIVEGAPEYTDAFMRYKLPKRARLLLSSGGDAPVLDTGSSEHSVFASVLLETLEANDAILSGPQLYAAMESKIRDKSAATGFEQRAEYKVIKGAGHEVGDFFLVPGG
ncbi:MAG: caspase family protein [Pseudomonadota bacterium]